MKKIKKEPVDTGFGYRIENGRMVREIKRIDLDSKGDTGADPLRNGLFRMFPSGDIVDLEERARRLSRFGKNSP